MNTKKLLALIVLIACQASTTTWAVDSQSLEEELKKAKTTVQDGGVIDQNNRELALASK